MKSIKIFLENQRLNYLQPRSNSDKQNIPSTPRNDFFKQTQEAFRGKKKDSEPGVIARIINRFRNQEN